MTREEKDMYRIGIYNSAIIIADKLGEDVVKGVLKKYGATSTEDIIISRLPEVFSELYAIETDIT